VSIIEERFCSVHTGHSVKGNSTESASFFVLVFEKKRVEQLHLLTGFSPILGFPGYILCLFLDGVCVYLFMFSIFHI
jgi:hypothetical protein